MNEEINCITNKEKPAKHKWENYHSDFPQALYRVYKIRKIPFPYLLNNNLFKEKDMSVLLKVINTGTS